MKKILFGLVCVSLLIVAGCDDKPEPVDPPVDPNAPVENKSEGIVKNQVFNGLSFEKTSLVYEQGNSTLTSKVTNNTDKDIILNGFKVVVKDANGTEIVRLHADGTGAIKPGESKTVLTYVDMDLSTNAYSIEYEAIK